MTCTGPCSPSPDRIANLMIQQPSSERPKSKTNSVGDELYDDHSGSIADSFMIGTYLFLGAIYSALTFPLRATRNKLKRKTSKFLEDTLRGYPWNID
jgi:hypothetical protein